MGELIQSKYPFTLFNEEAFSIEWIMNEVITGYMSLSEYYHNDFSVINTGILISKCPDLFKLGVIGRICTLGEDYKCSIFNKDTNDEIRAIYFDEYDQNLVNTCEFIENFELTTFGFGGFPQEPEYLDRFNHDISTALDMAHLFFLDSQIDIESLNWFAKKYDKPDTPPPFSNEGIAKIFRNVPIVRVW